MYLVGVYSVLNIKYVFLDQALLHTYGLPRTRRNDETADGTEISKYIGLDSRQLFDNYPIITQNPTEHH